MGKLMKFQLLRTEFVSLPQNSMSVIHVVSVVACPSFLKPFTEFKESQPLQAVWIYCCESVG